MKDPYDESVLYTVYCRSWQSIYKPVSSLWYCTIILQEITLAKMKWVLRSILLYYFFLLFPQIVVKLYITWNLPFNHFSVYSLVVLSKFIKLYSHHQHPSPERLLFWKTETLCPFIRLINFCRNLFLSFGQKTNPKGLQYYTNMQKYPRTFWKKEKQDFLQLKVVNITIPNLFTDLIKRCKI